jgi:hypothetical protein
MTEFEYTQVYTRCVNCCDNKGEDFRKANLCEMCRHRVFMPKARTEVPFEQIRYGCVLRADCWVIPLKDLEL